MNKGVQYATFELVGLINCGDYFEEDALSIVFNEFCKTAADILYGDIYFHQDIVDQSFKKRMRPDHTRLDHTMSIFHPATFVKKTCYLRYGLFNEKYKVAADYDLLLRFYLRNLHFKYIPSVLTHFVAGGNCDLRPRQRLADYYNIWKENLGLFKALLYFIKLFINHCYFSSRKFLLELFIGKSNYNSLKQYFYSKRQ
jgi:hypothetical protein